MSEFEHNIKTYKVDDENVVFLAYLRVSQADEHIENQELAIKQHISMEFPDIQPDILFFKDEAVSGSLPPNKRNGFAQLLSFLQALDKATKPHLYVYELSRIGRNFYETLSTIHQLEEKHNVRIKTISPRHS